MLKRLLPRETSFFDFFEKHAALTTAAMREFRALAEPGADIRGQAARIKELERQADDVTHVCIEALHKTFITPMDRADIHNLITRMDDILDAVDSAASRIELYEITVVRPEAGLMADALVAAATAIEDAVKSLRNLNKANEIKEKCITIHERENQGDEILRSALVRLFREEGQPILVIKWKEIYERLEKATDRCEAVANVIEGMVIESS